eukprot:gb/GECG01002786.1/.p1 GENE.gb/GECG01002786.1/~~gb/GECG01002786.1/.p1  ORF type:complete len:419 (+),score=36.79 gb/GECG01002786.1/:1-1257(+)
MGERAALVFAIRSAQWEQLSESLPDASDSPDYLTNLTEFALDDSESSPIFPSSWWEKTPANVEGTSLYPTSLLHEVSRVFLLPTSEAEATPDVPSLQFLLGRHSKPSIDVIDIVTPLSSEEWVLRPILDILVENSANEFLELLMHYTASDGGYRDAESRERGNHIFSRALENPKIGSTVLCLLAEKLASPGYDHVNNAVVEHRSAVFHSLAKAGISLDEMDANRMTALATCCKLLSQETFESLEELLRTGADPSTRCVYSRCALHFLCVPMHQDYQLLRKSMHAILTRNTEVLHCSDDFGFKPFDYAVDRNNVPITKAMLDSFMVDVPFEKICQCPVRLKVLDTTYSAGSHRSHGMKVNKKLSESERIVLVWYNHFAKLRYPIVKARAWRKMRKTGQEAEYVRDQDAKESPLKKIDTG